MVPLLEDLAKEFERTHNANIIIAGHGSSAGISAVSDGLANFGMVSRNLTTDELAYNLTTLPLAFDAIAIIVHSQNLIGNISTKNLREIFYGEIVCWSELGGEKDFIQLIGRDEGSGSRINIHQSLEITSTAQYKSIYNDSGKVILHVQNNPRAIGYINLSRLIDSVKPLQINNFYPTETAILSGDYPLVQTFSLIYNSAFLNDYAHIFLQFLQSDRAYEIMREHNVVPT